MFVMHICQNWSFGSNENKRMHHFCSCWDWIIEMKPKILDICGEENRSMLTLEGMDKYTTAVQSPSLRLSSGHMGAVSGIFKYLKTKENHIYHLPDIWDWQTQFSINSLRSAYVSLFQSLKSASEADAPKIFARIANLAGYSLNFGARNFMELVMVGKFGRYIFLASSQFLSRLELTTQLEGSGKRGHGKRSAFRQLTLQLIPHGRFGWKPFCTKIIF